MRAGHAHRRRRGLKASAASASLGALHMSNWQAPDRAWRINVSKQHRRGGFRRR
jgi:hypothetical protein